MASLMFDIYEVIDPLTKNLQYPVRASRQGSIPRFEIVLMSSTGLKLFQVYKSSSVRIKGGDGSGQRLCQGLSDDHTDHLYSSGQQRSMFLPEPLSVLELKESSQREDKTPNLND